jgi:hypothetical protein
LTRGLPRPLDHAHVVIENQILRYIPRNKLPTHTTTPALEVQHFYFAQSVSITAKARLFIEGIKRRERWL